MQRIYFSSRGPWDWAQGRHIDNAAHRIPWFTWDATPDLSQATWEWPRRWKQPGAVALLMRTDGL